MVLEVAEWLLPVEAVVTEVFAGDCTSVEEFATEEADEDYGCEAF